jgi:hypothetical protein
MNLLHLSLYDLYEKKTKKLIHNLEFMANYLWLPA